jgi:RNA-binding protein YhbY
MSDEDKKKYIEEIFKYCKVDSILVIGKTGQLERLQCPFFNDGIN